jgi:hypothetical protein
LLRSDDEAQEAAAPVDDYFYPSTGAYYYMETDDQE